MTEFYCFPTIVADDCIRCRRVSKGWRPVSLFIEFLICDRVPFCSRSSSHPSSVDRRWNAPIVHTLSKRWPTFFCSPSPKGLPLQIRIVASIVLDFWIVSFLACKLPLLVCRLYCKTCLSILNAYLHTATNAETKWWYLTKCFKIDHSKNYLQYFNNFNIDKLIHQLDLRTYITCICLGL